MPLHPLYIFSGLGTDSRVFKNIDFGDPPVVFIQWLTPQNKENITAYAKRLSQQITAPKPVLIGVSFGGMLAIEVSKHIAAEQIILMASAKNKYEIPPYFRLAGKLRLNRLVPSRWLIYPNPFAYWLFGTKRKEDKQLLAAILKDTNPAYLSWAIHEIIHWKNIFLPNNLTHMHGTADRLLPFHYIQAAIPIQNGGHFMTVDKADELTSAIQSLILT